MENLSAYVLRRFILILEKYQEIDPMMAYLFGYHTAEELEHKGVCFDRYTDMYGHMPTTENSAHKNEWKTFNEMVLEDLFKSVLYFMAIDQLIGGKPITIDKNKLCEEFFWGFRYFCSLQFI
nr:metal-dependent hydrolase [Candidatus Coxiella mudrowiae]